MATNNEGDESPESPIRANLISRMTDIEELLANGNYIEAVSTHSMISITDVLMN
jgi:hypothetical protein